MTTLDEHVGFAPGETVQIADRSGAEPDFNSVVLREPEYEALEPMLRVVEPGLHAMWRYGETELSAESAGRLAELLAEPSGAHLSAEQVELFRLLGGWIRSRLAGGGTIHVLGY